MISLGSYYLFLFILDILRVTEEVVNETENDLDHKKPFRHHENDSTY